MKNVTVVIGSGSIGQAIARRVSAGTHVLRSDLRQENADAAAKTLPDAGFDVSTAARPSRRCCAVRRAMQSARACALF
jgi:predicted dinucleotide-binding enzyme